MKIVFIGPFGLQPKGTVSVRALPLARALVKRGHVVIVLIPPWDDPGRAGQSWLDAGVEVVNVPLPPKLPLFFSLWLTWTLAVRTLTLQPDAVHFFKPKGFAGLTHWLLWALRLFTRAPVRLVLDADDWEQAWNEVLPYSGLQKLIFAWQERWGLRRADAVTVASRELEKLAKQVRGRRDVFYLPNGFQPLLQIQADAPALQAVQQRWQLGPGPVVLLYSRFAEFRLERVVSLVRLVAAKVPQARWLVVGQGLYGEDKNLAQQLQQAGLLEFVIFTGWLPVEDLPAIFALSAVAAFPYDDTLINRTKCSVKLIDLLAAGVPVVADAVGQNNEYIQSGESGVLVEPENDRALGQALVELLTAPERRQAMATAARERIRRDFDWFKLAEIGERTYR
ncbi:MAG: D-inositol-3-phosphate glycosyltransferase [Anaerolineae bacterium]|nr:D-inositol-3-phosphate glycosyltransferase [Anaerolineae bacterium]